MCLHVVSPVSASPNFVIVVVNCSEKCRKAFFQDITLASLTSMAHLSGAMEKQTGGLLEGFAFLLAAIFHGAGAFLLVLFL